MNQSPHESDVTLFCSEHNASFLSIKKIRSLQEDEVFIVLLDTTSLLHLANDYLQYLSVDEIEIINKLHKQADRERKIIAKAVLKQLMAQLLNISISSIKIEKEILGKPFLQSNHRPPLFFNISDSGTLVLMAFSLSNIGVDIELKSTRLFMHEMVADNFSVEEELQMSKAEDIIDFFYTIWTRKEAILKAAGIGVTDYLKELNVVTGKNIIAHKVLPLTGVWHIYSFNIPPLGKAAVAVPQSSQQLYFFDYLATNL